MKFLIFAYHTNYPMGAVGDFKASRDTEEECQEWIKENEEHYQFIDIFDLETKEISHFRLGGRRTTPEIYKITTQGAIKK